MNASHKKKGEKMIEKLTVQEHIVLLGLARGETHKEIAIEYEIPLNRIEKLKNSIIKKLSARNLPNAVCIAFANGLIQPMPPPRVEKYHLLKWGL